MFHMQTFVCILFLFATEYVDIGETLVLPKCHDYIKIPKNGSLHGALFPILSPEELESDCWNLEAFRNCMQAISNPAIQEKMLDSFILLKFLTSVCYENKEIYLNNSQCIGSYNETTESCIKEILPDHMCSIVNERIDCIGKTVSNCGSNAVQLTKLLMRTIFETFWDYYYTSCPVPTILPSKNASSKMSSAMLSLLPSSLLLWIGLH